MSNLKNLTKLYIGGNKFKTIPKEVLNLINLTKLDLSENKLIEFPVKISNLKNLTKLYIAANKFKTIPKEIGKLKNLKILNLDYNELTKLPNEIKNLTNLNILNLESQKQDVDIANICNVFAEYPKKIIISTEHRSYNSDNSKLLIKITNRLIKLPKEIGKLKNLIELKFSTSSEIISLPKEIFYSENLNTKSWYKIIEIIKDKNDNKENILKCLLQIKKNNEKENKSFFLLNYKIAKQYRLLGNNKKALKYLNKYTELEKNINIKNTSIISMLAYEFACLYLAINNFEEVEKYILKIEETSIVESRIWNDKTYLLNFMTIWYRMGNKLFYGKNYQNAIYCYLKSLAEGNNNVNILIKLAISYLALNKFNEAEKYILKINNSKKIVEIWIKSGLEFFRKKNYKNALKCYLKANEIDKNNPSALYTLSLIYLKLNNKLKSYEIAKKLIEIEKKYYNYTHLSWCSLFVNKPQEAITSAQKALELEPKHIISNKNLALGYVVNNEFDKAKPIYKKWKNKYFYIGEETCKEIFLQDLKELEQAGITHKDFERVRELLK